MRAEKSAADFIKGFFDSTYVEKILSNGQRAGYRAWDDVLELWRGAYLSREKEDFLRWPSVADTIYGMILLDQWLDPEEHPAQRSGTSLSHRTGRSRKGFGFYFAPGGH